MEAWMLKVFVASNEDQNLACNCLMTFLVASIH